MTNLPDTIQIAEDVKLSPSQEKALLHIYYGLVRYHFSDLLLAAERYTTPTDEQIANSAYEFKKFTVEMLGDGYAARKLWVQTETGRKNDEGTMAEILARDSRLFTVGKGGRIELKNQKDGKKRVRGEYAFFELVR